MYDVRTLKPAIKVDKSTVECPVRGCSYQVPRQWRRFQRLEKFMCPEHRIYISPTTFEYYERLDNLLWKERDDLELLFYRIAGVKREINRISRDNSEDAVTWNIFRYIEKHNLLQAFLSKITGQLIEDPEIIYWSYCQSENSVWSELQKARLEFETNPEKGSEPDLIVLAKNALFLIEAKLNATNKTIPRSHSSLVEERYTEGGRGWCGYVFNSDFKKVAIASKKYELLRFWLLGSWVAHNLGVNFFLFNLAPSRKEQDIETAFGKHIKQNQNIEHKRRVFLRIPWENIYSFILSTEEMSIQKRLVLDYFKNKTAGYNINHVLQSAFSIEQ